MKRFFTLFFVLTIAFGLRAQDYIQVSMGAGYSEQAYYTLADDNIQTVENGAWDLAFSVSPFSASILINESASYGASANRLWLSSMADFDEAIDFSAASDSLYNDETSWSNGAFNASADPSNPVDFGWGAYDPSTHNVNGNKVFILQLRDGNYKKIFVESLSAGVYTVKHANLDGSEEGTIAVNQNDYTGKPFVVYNFATDEVSAPVESFDMAFMRYTTLLATGDGEVEYTVGGVLTGAGVEVAKATGVANPQELGYEDYTDSFVEANNEIGHDWKNFDLGTFTWTIADDRAYFVKTADNHIWRVVFYDFEGSSTGTSTFIKDDLGMITPTTDIIETTASTLKVYPNPTVDYVEMAFVAQENTGIDFQIINALGQTVMTFDYQATTGLNAVGVDVAHLAEGNYRIVGKVNQTDVITSTLIITH